MVDGKPVKDQINKSHKLVNECFSKDMVIIEKSQSIALIEKFPSFWRNYRNIGNIKEKIRENTTHTQFIFQ